MFWGLIMEPNKRYTQTVEKAFHMSMASLDASTASGGLVQVMICYSNRNYLLCTLQKGTIWQVPLDLNFQEGTKIAFTCNGDGHVHLTGYLVPEEEGFDEMDDFDEEDEEDDEEIPALVGLKKRKAPALSKENAKKPLKKSKVEVNEDEDDESDSDDDDDEENGLGLEDDSDDDDDLDAEENDEDDDEEEDESDGDDEEEQQAMAAFTKLKQLKQQQQQKQSQQKEQNQQSQNKKGKEKLMNGKDTSVKSEKEHGKQKKNKDNKTEDKPEQLQKRRTVEGGVQVEDLKVGEGAPAKAGKFVSVYYVGRLKNGKKFDQTHQGDGFKFRLGRGEVIKGWDVGIAGMKIGGKRRLTIPPNMAYGAKGSPPVIPPNSQLTFEVELRAIH